jgi:hypothetical protein
MAVEWLIVAGDRIQIGENGLVPHGHPVSAEAGGALQSLLEAMVLCNDAVRGKKPDGTPGYAGSPTESLMVGFGMTSALSSSKTAKPLFLSETWQLASDLRLHRLHGHLTI